ncbi:RluA family pseudouridine synthase [bacterium]|nr:RluA family pseudouridine synthase [bacterium]
MKIKIIYQDKDVIIVEKPAGILVHPVKSKEHPKTLIDYLCKKFPEIKKVGNDPIRPGIVHRLDKDTSGLIIVARNNFSFNYLISKFSKGEIEKHYFALVYGKIKDKKGIINKAITISKNGKRKALLDKKSKSAITQYKVIKEFQVKNQWFSFLEVIPKTGRTHQIRVHLSSIGHPILGDKKYKFKRTPQIPELKRQFLHAYYLKFKLPSGILKSFASPLPTDLINSLKWLEKKSKG